MLFVFFLLGISYFFTSSHIISLRSCSAKNEVTHILHVSKELPSLEDPVELQESDLGSSDANDDNS